MKKEHFSILALVLSAVSATDTRAHEFSHACEAGESWKITLAQKSNWVNRFQVFAQGQESPWLAFSEAIQLKKISNLMKHGEFEADFSEYWVGRIFFQLGLYPLAYQFFFSSSENSRFPEIKGASHACLQKVYEKIPDWNPSMGLSMAVENTELQAALSEVKNRDYPAAVQKLRKFLESTVSLGIAKRSEYRDIAFLLLGRASYALGKFDESIQAFQKIDKRSNLQIDAMSDLAWAYLLSGRYAEALGVALQLRSGALKNTFSPESTMIAAMALNETCSYPDAVRMIQSFVHDYEKPFEWLIADQRKTNFYQEILNGLKNQSSAPIKIRTEWMKSAAFLVRQGEINLLIENSRTIAGIPAKVKTFQRDLALKNVSIIKTLIKDLRISELQKKPDPELGLRVIAARKEIRRVIRFNQASKIVVNVVKRYDATIPTEKAKLVSKINRDLNKRNGEMLALLKTVRENVDLIEVEVYNGASRELASIEREKKAAPNRPQFETALAWNWGRFPASEIEREEIWEDEMGALKANISNQCKK